ncbi:hypothetical protein [Streptomyces misionensis]|uniref:hypothetical protein n=1 Tax=Streptomyces misionensis TaxID=67331 RepID=UPI00396B5F29
MGATHIYRLDSPSAAVAARVHNERCTETHATLTHIPRLSNDELLALGLHTAPTWTRRLPGDEPITKTVVVRVPAQERALGDALTRARTAAADTQPLNTAEIKAGLTARADQETPKEHPEP